MTEDSPLVIQSVAPGIFYSESESVVGGLGLGVNDEEQTVLVQVSLRESPPDVALGHCVLDVSVLRPLGHDVQQTAAVRVRVHGP